MSANGFDWVSLIQSRVPSTNSSKKKEEAARRLPYEHGEHSVSSIADGTEGKATYPFGESRETERSVRSLIIPTEFLS